MDNKLYLCKKCNEEKPITEFYHSEKRYRSTLCKICHNEDSQNRRREKIEEQGGGERIPNGLNKYHDRIQKEQTFKFLKLLGWKFIDGKWFKEGIKELRDGKVYWINVTPTEKRTKKRVTPELTQEVLRLYELGTSQNEIGRMLNRNPSVIHRIIKNHGE